MIKYSISEPSVFPFLLVLFCPFLYLLPKTFRDTVHNTGKLRPLLANSVSTFSLFGTVSREDTEEIFSS